MTSVKDRPDQPKQANGITAPGKEAMEPLRRLSSTPSLWLFLAATGQIIFKQERGRSRPRTRLAPGEQVR